MKNLKIIPLFVYLFITQTTFAQVEMFRVQQLDEDFDVNALEKSKGVVVQTIDESKKGESKKFPATHLIFDLVRKNLSEDTVADWDALDYDQFYIRVNSWNNKDLIKKYPELTDKKIELLKQSFSNYEN
jgi:hypothetical protein